MKELLNKFINQSSHINQCFQLISFNKFLYKSAISIHAFFNIAEKIRAVTLLLNCNNGNNFFNIVSLFCPKPLDKFLPFLEFKTYSILALTKHSKLPFKGQYYIVTALRVEWMKRSTQQTLSSSKYPWTFNYNRIEPVGLFK